MQKKDQEKLSLKYICDVIIYISNSNFDRMNFFF